jgi:hypothetical protein
MTHARVRASDVEDEHGARVVVRRSGRSQWFTLLSIAELVVEALASLDFAFRKSSKTHLKELAPEP